MGLPQHRVRTPKRQVSHVGLASLGSGMGSLGLAHPLGTFPFFLAGVHGIHSLTWKPLPAVPREGQTLIAFAIPNPNPAGGDLTVPHTGRSSGHGSAYLALCLACVRPVAASQAQGRVCRVRTLLGLDVSVYSKTQSPWLPSSSMM